MTALVVVLVLLVGASVGFLLGCIWGVARHLHKRTNEDNHNDLREGK